MMNLVDEASGFVWSCPLKKKREAAGGFNKFLSWLRDQVSDSKASGKSNIHFISVLHSDRGGEFTSGPVGNEKKRSYFDKICMKHGIKRRLTSAYSPHQNGRAERANRTLFKTMRCALMDSGMKWKYWVDAYFVGLNARNRIPRTGGRASPFEIFYGFCPEFARLMPFGATAILGKRGSKKDIDKGIIGRMIGYPSDTNGWKFIVKGKNKPVVTEDAIFDLRTFEEQALRRAVQENNDEEEDKGLPLGGTDAEIREAIKDMKMK